MKKSVLLIGNGPMAEEYAKVLREGLKRPFSVAGRNLARVQEFQKKHGAENAYDLKALNEATVSQFGYAIVASSRDSLQGISEMLLELKMKALLVEKPVSSSASLAKKIDEAAQRQGAVVRVALNRRYYQSVQTLKQLLRTSRPVGGYFDFTELPHYVDVDHLPDPVLQRWAFGNSIHVFDTIRFLLGDFSEIQPTIAGKGELAWHTAGTHFFGAAKCGGLPVSYSSSWTSPGRWDIQVMTAEGRYKLSPMERLQILKPRTFNWVEVDADYAIDTTFKPGLYRMLEAFEGLVESGKPCDLPDLAANTKILSAISQIVGYPQ